MSKWGVVVLRFHEKPDCADIDSWRRDLLTEFAIDDFLDPLTLVRHQGEGPIPFDDGSIWMDVGTHCSVYERGYERGDPTFYVRLAEWIEEHIPECEVWYGNEVDDRTIKLFSVKERSELLEYYREVGHEPYNRKYRNKTESNFKDVAIPGLLELFAISVLFSIPLSFIGAWVGPIVSFRTYIAFPYILADRSGEQIFLAVVYLTVPLLFWFIGRVVHYFRLSPWWCIVGCPLFTVVWCLLIYF